MFYHGTTTSFEMSVILPSSQTGILREEWRNKNTNKVFMTTSLISAYKFARKAAIKYGGKPIVYIVEPQTYPIHINTNEYISDSAKIVGMV